MRNTLSVWGTLLMVLATLVSSCKKEVLLPFEEGASHKSSVNNPNQTGITPHFITLPTEFCGNAVTGDLLTNGNNIIDGGDYRIFNDETYLYVEIMTENPKKNFHATILDCNSALVIESIDQTGLNDDYTTMAFVLSGLPNSFCIELKANGKVHEIPDNGNYFAYLNFTVQSCCDLTMADLGMIGHGGWGSTPQGNNPGTYLNNFYDDITPITIGCAGNNKTFNTANDIKNYQRTEPNGTPGILPNAGVFSKQVMALALNIAFDEFDAQFSATDLHLGDLVVVNGILAGKTVNEVLAIANEVLGGCSTMYTPSAINEVVSSINDKVEGYLTCP